MTRRILPPPVAFALLTAMFSPSIALGDDDVGGASSTAEGEVFTPLSEQFDSLLKPDAPAPEAPSHVPGRSSTHIYLQRTPIS